jgi:hypothetical protein
VEVEVVEAVPHLQLPGDRLLQASAVVSTTPQIIQVSTTTRVAAEMEVEAVQQLQTPR